MTAAGFEIRRVVPGDLAGLVDLALACFPAVGARPRDEVERKLGQLFLDGPFCDATLPSLVARDARGALVGFRGHLRRHWRLGDEPLLGSTGTHFMVRREMRRRGVSMALRLAWRRLEAESTLRRDVGYGDRSTEDGRSFGTSDPERRAVQLEHHGFEWVLPLRPRALRVLRRLGPRLPAGLRPRLRERLRAGRVRLRAPAAEPPRTAPLSPAALCEAIEAAGRDRPLRIDEPLETCRWLLDYLAAYPSRGRFLGRLLLDDAGAPLGFYCGYANEAGGYELVGFAAPLAEEERALDRVLTDAADEGALFVAGVACARELRPLLERGAELSSGAWASIRSKRPAVVRAFLAMEVLLTGLEGERWL